MGDEHLSTILETESDELTKSSVEDLVPIPSESKGISNNTCDVPFCDNSPPLDVLNDHFEIFSNFNDCTSSDDDSFEDIDYVEASPPDYKLVSLEDVKDDILHEKLLNINLLITCYLPSSDDFSPISIFEEKSVTFSNPLFDSNDDFTSSDDDSLSDEDVPKENVKIYSNPLFEFDDEYISSDDECFTPSDDVELLLHHDPSISVVSILEGFTDEPLLEENDDLFDLESKENDWKKILYDAPIDDLISTDIYQKGQNRNKNGQSRAQEWKEDEKPKPKAYLSLMGQPGKSLAPLALPKLPMLLEGFYDVRDDVNGLTAWQSMTIIERKGRGIIGYSKANGLGKDFPNPFMADSFPKTLKQSNDPPLSRGYTLRSGEDSLQLMELMANCTQIVCFVRKKNREIYTTEEGLQAISATIDGHEKLITEASLRRHLKLEDAEGIYSLSNEEIFEQLAHMGYQTKKTYSTDLTKLVLRVKKLEYKLKSGKARRKAKIVLSDDEEIAEDSSKQGRKISQIDEDPTISLVQDEGISWIPQEEEVHEKPSDETEVIVQEETPTEIIEEHGSGEKGEMEISTASPPKVTKVSTAEAHVYTRRKAKDKGKAIMEEPATPKKVKKRTQVQLSMDEELARKMEEEERARFNAEQEARALQEEEEERLNLEAAWELQKQLDERQQVPTEATQSKGIDWNDPSVLRYHALKNKPVSIAQARRNMITYLKNQGGYKESYFKRMSYNDIRPIFERVWDHVNTFIPIGSEVEKGSSKPSKRETSKTVEEEKVEKEDVKPDPIMIEKKAVGIRRKTLARRRASDKITD
ncbi:hypothetical protein Tco_1516318 [Tanacetum coccineum]